MNRKFLPVALVLFGLSACNLAPSTPIYNAPPAATQPPSEGPASSGASTSTVQAGPPQSEAGVPRVTAAEARAAFDSGEAVIVDVRGQGAYEAQHVAGALYIPLGAIETDPVHLPLDPDQWIITYCT